MANGITPGTVHPTNPNYIMGSGGQWVLESTTGPGGLNDPNAGTTTNLSAAGATTTNTTHYKVYLGTSSAEFYVGGTLYATHTTNLPNGGDVYVGFGGDTDTDDILNIVKPIVTQQIG